MLPHLMLEAGGGLVKTIVPNTPLPSHSGRKESSAVPNGWSGNNGKKYHSCERLLILAKNKGSETGRKCSF